MRFTQIILRHMPRSEALSGRIREVSEKLELQHPRINNIRVVVESTGNHHHMGHEYLVSVHVHLPGREIVANRHRHKDVYVALRDAFAAVEHQLEPEHMAA